MGVGVGVGAGVWARGTRLEAPQGRYDTRRPAGRRWRSSARGHGWLDVVVVVWPVQEPTVEMAQSLSGPAGTPAAGDTQVGLLRRGASEQCVRACTYLTHIDTHIHARTYTAAAWAYGTHLTRARRGAIRCVGRQRAGTDVQ